MGKKQLSQKTADTLARLYSDLKYTPPDDFDQSNCDLCIIGNGIKTGSVRGESFKGVVSKISFPRLNNQDGMTYMGNNPYAFYLFGGRNMVQDAAQKLWFPNFYNGVGVIAAQQRIQHVLEYFGYELVNP